MLSHLNPAPRAPGRVVILGANGFISRHLQAWCRSGGIECIAVGSSDIDLCVTDNAPRLAALLRPDDAVVMTSILTPDKGRDAGTLMRNLRMAETACLALERSSCAHFVYLSSDAVYDAHQVPLDEDSTREPTDLYALAHTAREMMLGSTLKAKGVPLCILRLTSIYGPGDTHNSYGPNKFVRSALKEGRISLFGQGEELRSHVHVDDAVALAGLALGHRSAGVVNVASHHAVSFSDIAQAIARIAGRPVRIESAPRATPVVHRTFDSSALRAAFPGYLLTELGAGLARFVEIERGLDGVPGNVSSAGVQA